MVLHGSDRFLVAFLTGLRLGACFWLFGREVVSLAIRGVQKLQRATLATMVLLLF